ncbi:MAG: site-specific integrase, partial [Bacteroidia bacterium]|nr:site-specific integrase [Bacteroidia bacterium]
MTTKVTLRQKKISKGRQSLYLDFYPAIPHPETGEPTRREFLGL